jgi:hypothetical protein
MEPTSQVGSDLLIRKKRKGECIRKLKERDDIKK